MVVTKRHTSKKTKKTGKPTKDYLAALPFLCAYDASRYSRSFLMARKTEDSVQSEIVEFLRSNLVDVVVIDAGGGKSRGRVEGLIRKTGVVLDVSSLLKRHGGSAPEGWPDLEATLAPSGRGLYIEVKRPSWTDGAGKTIKDAGYATYAQLECLASKYLRGALVCVAWSLDDVRTVLGSLIDENRKFMQPHVLAEATKH